MERDLDRNQKKLKNKGRIAERNTEERKNERYMG